MIKLENISKIGVGTYRMSIDNDDHKEALEYAIDYGINLIDSASNYQNGDSEQLIGKIIDKKTRKKVFIITKAGYIQNNDIHKLSLINLKKTIKINNNFYYSIDKSFIDLQIKQSLERMNTEYIDCFLIHNPEHYFDTPNEHQNNINHHIINIFNFLEDLVKTGVIRYYGISSNHLPNPSLQNFELENLLKLKNNFPHFKFVQFPFNLIECDASLKLYGIYSLIEMCKNYDIKCISNRPFNTVYENKTLKLIDYSFDYNSINEQKEFDLFNNLILIIKNRLNELGETTPVESFIPIKFLIENRKNIANEFALNKVISSYLLPFLKQINLIDGKTLNLLSLLKKEWVLFIKINNNDRLTRLKNHKGINREVDFNEYLYNLYLEKGIDHILMGLRKKEYLTKLLLK
ncbi:aldo/keto reductase [Chishuiella sp.]|uniref:aldo/keto reductase n=1 Tax=Chishuiella sp. TaxID=1969467 RepID=UPI0028AB4758|nr:aldo/keto reductase [Chishuiella sp.]